MRATAEFGLENRKTVRVRAVFQLVGQVLRLQLSLGLVCSGCAASTCYLTASDAARAKTYNPLILGRAIEELQL